MAAVVGAELSAPKHEESAGARNMSDLESRIEQFRKITQQSPTDPLGFFSLGRALVEADRFDDAVLSLQRALAMDAKLSRAYQLLARAQLGLGRKDEAVKTLTDGVMVAHQRGEPMPKNEMIAMLKEHGAAVPEFEPPRSMAVGEGQVMDLRTGRPGSRLPKPPMRNKLGQLIFDNVSVESWKEWIGQGTKVINELRLPMHDPSAQRIYDQHMIDFLNLKEICEKEGVKI
jgi:Fe-S cluster biosynthesis and repair protein YggX